MAVPAVYAKLVEYARKILDNPSERENDSHTATSDKSTTSTMSYRDICKALAVAGRLRLCVSGSAALPDPLLEAWQDLTGQILLERYGMTEIGMALSNPLKGTRRKGHVGQPLPFVQCMIVAESDCTSGDVDNINGVSQSERVIEPSEIDSPGELRVKGPCVFKEYLNRHDATREAFDANGYFRTGDVAAYSASGDFKLLGRNSIDIIKSAGYKLSALEIERELLGHPGILESAVIGIPNDTLGEVVLAIVVLRDAPPRNDDNTRTALSDANIDAEMQAFLADRMVKYKWPRLYVISDQPLPRNHMGKVDKKMLKSETIQRLAL
jgi:malonyl-CoA/methylmalonyl-CoA synthetase